MKKRITAILLCLVMVFAMLPVSAAAASTVTITFNTASTESGESVLTLYVDEEATEHGYASNLGAYTWSAQNLPSVLSISTSLKSDGALYNGFVIQGTPTVLNETGTLVTVTATDKENNIAAETTVRIKVVNRPDTVQEVLDKANLVVFMDEANTEKAVLSYLETAIWEVDGIADAFKDNYGLDDIETAKQYVTIAAMQTADGESSFTAAVAGTAADKDGTDGRLDFALILGEDGEAVAISSICVAATPCLQTYTYAVNLIYGDQTFTYSFESEKTASSIDENNKDFMKVFNNFKSAIEADGNRLVSLTLTLKGMSNSIIDYNSKTGEFDTLYINLYSIDPTRNIEATVEPITETIQTVSVINGTDSNGNKLLLTADSGQSFSSDVKFKIEDHQTSDSEIIGAAQAAGYSSTTKADITELGATVNVHGSITLSCDEATLKKFMNYTESNSTALALANLITRVSEYACEYDGYYYSLHGLDLVDNKYVISLGDTILLEKYSLINGKNELDGIKVKEHMGFVVSYLSDSKVVLQGTSSNCSRVEIYYEEFRAGGYGNISYVAGFGDTYQMIKGTAEKRYVSVDGVIYQAEWYNNRKHNFAFLYDLDGNLAGIYSTVITKNGKPTANFRTGYSPSELKKSDDTGNGLIFKSGGKTYSASVVWDDDISLVSGSGKQVLPDGTATLNVTLTGVSTSTELIPAHNTGSGIEIGIMHSEKNASSMTLEYSVNDWSPFYLVAVTQVTEPKTESVTAQTSEDEDDTETTAATTEATETDTDTVSPKTGYGSLAHFSALFVACGAGLMLTLFVRKKKYN